jgi:hypothetical protein
MQGRIHQTNDYHNMLERGEEMTDLPPTMINAATAIYALKVTHDGVSRPADQRLLAKRAIEAGWQMQKELESTDKEGIGR